MFGKIRLWPVLAGGAVLVVAGLGVWATTGNARPTTAVSPTLTPPPATATTTAPTDSSAPVEQVTAVSSPESAPPAAQVSPVAPHFAALRPPIRYAALGASDTVGVGATNPDKENWTAQLAAKLPPDTQFQRFARSGITLSESLQTQVPAAIASNPDLITVWLIVNDGLRGVPAESYRVSLRMLLTRLTQETHATIVLLNAPDISQILPPQATPTTRIAVQMVTRQWNQLIAEEAAAFADRVLLVDLYGPSQQATNQPDWVSPDRFHPSSAGYGALAQVVYTAMQQAGLVDPQP